MLRNANFFLVRDDCVLNEYYVFDLDRKKPIVLLTRTNKKLLHQYLPRVYCFPDTLRK